MITLKEHYDKVFKLDENDTAQWQLTKSNVNPKGYKRPISNIIKDDFKECLKEDPHFFPFLYFAIIEKKLSDKHELFYTAYDDWLHSVDYKSPYSREEVELIFSAATLLLKPNEEELFDHFVDCIQYPINHPFFFDKLGVSVEDWISNLIWMDKDKCVLHPFLSKNIKKDDLGYKIIQKLIRDFFLPRYDFTSVTKLLKILNDEELKKNKKQENNGDSKKSTKPNWLHQLFISASVLFNSSKPLKNILSSILLIVAPLSIIALTYYNVAFNFSFIGNIYPRIFESGQYQIKSVNPHAVVNNITFNSILGIIEPLLFLLIVLIIIIVLIKPTFIHLLSPRLFIGILVGYVSIMTNTTFWNLAVSTAFGASEWILFTLAFAFLLLTYLYLLFEVKTGAGNINPCMLNIRTLNIFSLGIVYSFIIGLLFVDLFTPIYLETAFKSGVLIHLEENNRLHAAFFGVIDPLMVLFFFSLALFIGVVLQFIWKDKPVTYPVR